MCPAEMCIFLVPNEGPNEVIVLVVCSDMFMFFSIKCNIIKPYLNVFGYNNCPPAAFGSSLIVNLLFNLSSSAVVLLWFGLT